MQRWRAADQQPVATRGAIGAALGAIADGVLDLARTTGTRPLVVACWQDQDYLGAPDSLPTRLAGVADLVVACVGRPRLPGEVEHVELDHDEPLAAEWSITAVTPWTGLAFVAREAGATLPAPTVERGRAFRWDTTMDPSEVVATSRRMLRDIGARAKPTTVAALRAATTALADTVGPSIDGERVEHELERTIAALVASHDERPGPLAWDPDERPGLAELAQWLTDAGPRAPTLGMVVVRCADARAGAALRSRVAALGRAGDVVVDVPPDAAMLVLPDLTGGALEARTRTVRHALELALGCEVTAVGVEVPAVAARHDLVGSLGRALVTLRTATDRPSIGAPSIGATTPVHA